MKRNIFKEFKSFLIRGNLIDLAVAVIIGKAFTGIIDSLVNDIIMPLIGMVVGKIDFSKLEWVLNSGSNNGHKVVIKYGNFIGEAMNFFVISLCIFGFITLIGENPNKIKTKDEAKNEQGQKTNDLLEEIRDALKNKQ